MEVKLINYTPFAKELLIFAKRTRLLNSVDDYENVLRMSEEEKAKELEYVFGTIGSSLEFVEYTFLITGVTRAFTHQLVRHRVGTAFAQQSQRTVDLSTGFDYISTGECKQLKFYHEGMEKIGEAYKECIKHGAKPEDARGLLPTNVCTNILFKCNLRTLSHIMSVRLCKRTQGEFQDVAKLMRKEVIDIHPWAEPILCAHCIQTGTCAFKGKDCPVKATLPKWDNRDKALEIWEKIVGYE